MDKIEVVVKVDEMVFGGWHGTKQALAEAGLSDLEAFPRFRMLVGWLAADKMAAFQNIPGVLSIRRQDNFDAQTS